MNILTDVLPRRQNKGFVILIFTILYASLFTVALIASKDPSSARIGFFFALLTGYFYGKKTGLFFGLILSSTTGLIITISGISELTVRASIVHLIMGTVFFSLIGFFTGLISDLVKKLKQEIIARELAEKELAEYKDHLEELVLKRTAELEMANDRIRQAEKMEALGQLTGGIAHDFNNLLFAISGMVEMMDLKFGNNNDGIKYYTNSLNKIINEATDFIKTLMTFARKNRKEVKPIDMHELLESSIKLLTHTIGKKIEIESSFEASTTVIAGDYSLLQNVFLNLGSNARDAMPEGGKLSISTTNRISTDTIIENNQNSINSYLEILVKDTGIGIDKEKQQKIFEPFFTTKPSGEGTGMGLSSSLGTIEMHKGKIDVKSEKGRGTTFKIILPCHNIERRMAY